MDWSILVERIRRRDPEGDILLYERFGARIDFLARQLLRSDALADDVRSETLVRVLKAITEDRLRTPDALPGFVLQTARNVVRERQRQAGRHVPIESVPERAAQAGFDRTFDPLAVRALKVAAAALGPRDRAFLRMYYVEELPRQEIARRLGVAEARVRLVKSRALERFRVAYHALVSPLGERTER